MVSYLKWPLHREAKGKGSFFLHQENKDLMTWIQAERKTCKKCGAFKNLLNSFEVTTVTILIHAVKVGVTYLDFQG